MAVSSSGIISTYIPRVVHNSSAPDVPLPQSQYVYLRCEQSILCGQLVCFVLDTGCHHDLYVLPDLQGGRQAGACVVQESSSCRSAQQTSPDQWDHRVSSGPAGHFSGDRRRHYAPYQ
uniref:Uncharacterized protein n=1 Tax=Cacopsylla melanoneura TaxID=428564 RepID=A0A8D9E335_9HEMI